MIQLRLPRWTVYPAVALLLGIVVVAVPRSFDGRAAGRARQQRTRRLEAQAASSVVQLEDYLPRGFARDGSVDYREQIQHALDEVGDRELVLPDAPLRVEPLSGERWCLELHSGAHLRAAGPRSELFTTTPAVQVLRGEHVNDITLEGFRLRGVGGDGERLAHGLLQLTHGARVVVRDLTVSHADADGIAIAGVTTVLVEDNTLVRTSKSGVYLSHCTDAVVRDNTVSDFGGHLLAGGVPVGAGIQLSSNTRLVCEGNEVSDGIGIGILCNALVGGCLPLENELRRNRVANVDNPDNPSSSGGIRCANGGEERSTRTQLLDNHVLECGANGIHLENHGDSRLEGNTVRQSRRAGIVIGTVDTLEVTHNVVLENDTQGTGGQAGVHLINEASHVTVQGNLVRGRAASASRPAAPALMDQSSGAGNSLELTLSQGNAPPISGQHRIGDLVHDPSPLPGDPLGWICVEGGAPGVWEPIGRPDR